MITATQFATETLPHTLGRAIIYLTDQASHFCCGRDDTI